MRLHLIGNICLLMGKTMLCRRAGGLSSFGIQYGGSLDIYHCLYGKNNWENMENMYFVMAGSHQIVVFSWILATK